MKLELPDGKFDAYLFDCDGTIADSMPLHFEAWSVALSEWNGHFPEDLFYLWGGVPVRQVVERLNQKFSLSMPVEEVLARKEQIYYDFLPKIQAVKSVVDHIYDQHGKIPFAVVSGSPRESIFKTLNALDLLDYFPIIVGAEDYTNGKPDPEPFLRAAEILNVQPERCLVFEDAEMGIESARAAGMAWVKVPRQL